MNSFCISEIQIVPVKPNNGHVGFASAVINNQFYISDIAIHTAPNKSYGYRVVYPVKTLANGKRVHSLYPINKEVGDEVEKAISNEFAKLIENFGDVG